MGRKQRLKKERKERLQRLGEELQAIYDHIPEIKCKRLCVESCGPIPVYVIEMARIVSNTHISRQTLTESAIGRKQHGSVLLANDQMICPMLDGTECTVHNMRPLICRLYGQVRGMECEHGCASELMDPDLVTQVLTDIEELNGLAT